MRPTLLAVLSSVVASASASGRHAGNSTINNPILPGFHPDPSCIFVQEWDDTFFCASSSFNAFPGIPMHASKDLQTWKLIGHVLNRPEQLPKLAETNRSTRYGASAETSTGVVVLTRSSGIWAPTIRYNKGTFWLVTTLVDDDRPQTDFSRWTNVRRHQAGDAEY
jgi:beta-xylosidase